MRSNPPFLRRLGWPAVCLAATLAVTATASVEVRERRTPPNFIVILGEGGGWASTSVQMDDRNPASRGTGIKTPNLERLAAAGMRFSQGYAASPRCTPSRAALFTGRSPAALRMTFVPMGRERAPVARRLTVPQPLVELPAEDTTVGELLRNSGYATAHFGKWHVGRQHPSRHGFDESDGPTGNGGPENVPDPNPKQALEMTSRGIAFMERQAQAGRSFYLQLSHYPSQPDRRNGGAPRAGDLHQKEVLATDRSVGEVLDAVERLKLRETTYVIYTTDHGTPGRNAPLRGGKGGVWEGGLRVPFLVAGPGIRGGACSYVPVSATDLFSTFAEFAGVKPPLPSGVEGGSLATLLRAGGEGSVRRARAELVVHFPHYDDDPLGPASAILLGDYKLIRFYESGERRLYDLRRDLSEESNLAAQLPEKVSELDRRLTTYLQEVGAQLPIPNPSFEGEPGKR